MTLVNLDAIFLTPPDATGTRWVSDDDGQRYCGVCVQPIRADATGYLTMVMDDGTEQRFAIHEDCGLDVAELAAAQPDDWEVSVRVVREGED